MGLVYWSASPTAQQRLTSNIEDKDQNMATQGTKKTNAGKTSAVELLAAEATGAIGVTLEFRGETLTIDPDALDDYEVVTTLTQGMPMLALSVLIPDSEAQARLLDTCDKNAAGRPKLSAVLEMVTDIMQVVGAGK